MQTDNLKATTELRLLRPDEIPHILGEGELGAVLEWAVHDPTTGIINEHVVKKSESFVLGFLKMLFCLMSYSCLTSPVAITDTSGVSRNIYRPLSSSSYLLDLLAGAGNTSWGIVVGTNSTAPTITDNALWSLINHGTGAGQLQYSAMTFGLPASDVSTSQVTITRNFSNASGASITVNEIGAYCRAYDGSTRYICIIRDVITGGIAVPNGQTLTVNYRLQATV